MSPATADSIGAVRSNRREIRAFTFGEPAQAKVVYAGPDRTTTITIFTYRTGFSAFDIGRTAAIAWIFVVIVLIVSAPLLRHLLKSAEDDA